jgi:hypothetical protein
MSEIQKADPATRRTSLLILGGGAAAGVILLTVAGSFRPAFQSWLEQAPRGRLTLATVVLAVITSAPLLGLAWYLWRLGRRIGLGERYPPPGYRVIRDTPVVAGALARRIGRLVQCWRPLSPRPH